MQLLDRLTPPFTEQSNKSTTPQTLIALMITRSSIAVFPTLFDLCKDSLLASSQAWGRKAVTVKVRYNQSYSNINIGGSKFYHDIAAIGPVATDVEAAVKEWSNILSVSEQQFKDGVDSTSG